MWNNWEKELKANKGNQMWLLKYISFIAMFLIAIGDMADYSSQL